MKYISTRGSAPALSFEDVVLTGLANDGGLYVPQNLPSFTREEISSMAGMSYPELAFVIIKPFVDGEIPDQDLQTIIDKAYKGFRHPAIAPLVQIDRAEWILELFQGPTLAFKDFALQFLGHLLDYLLAKRDQRAVVMGATSGDTGSAAIEGCRNCSNLDVFILHPHERVSDVQRRQMTSVIAPNVHNIAVQGNFDDCQNAVKASFRDQAFMPNDLPLVAVNSINWARIMAQIVYYFYSAVALGSPHRRMSYSVPTGNFGDIYAGYLASKMGLPIDQLIIATNSNDILHRCISRNDHSKQDLLHSLSPSMDIMVSSNFERLLFDLYGQSGSEITRLMSEFESGVMLLEESVLADARELFASFSMNDDAMLQTISDVYKQSEYLLDPHTAIGVAAARMLRRNPASPMICLATAHPAKFPEAIQTVMPELTPALPLHMQDLFERPEAYDVLPNDLSVIHSHMLKRLKER
ncbi:MAG TPA: threonine synthase [Gammaproteobacteria bacterium]|nr:threonine synthase [Gammaproteobacteria bacterium]